MLKVIYCEIGKAPEIREIPNTLEAMQELVGGYIEALDYLLPQSYTVICDEEAKLKGKPFNRMFTLHNKYILGNFFIVESKTDDFVSIQDTQKVLQLLNQYTI